MVCNFSVVAAFFPFRVARWNIFSHQCGEVWPDPTTFCLTAHRTFPYLVKRRAIELQVIIDMMLDWIFHNITIDGTIGCLYWVLYGQFHRSLEGYLTSFEKILNTSRWRRYHFFCALFLPKEDSCRWKIFLVAVVQGTLRDISHWEDTLHQSRMQYSVPQLCHTGHQMELSQLSFMFWSWRSVCVSCACSAWFGMLSPGWEYFEFHNVAVRSSYSIPLWFVWVEGKPGKHCWMAKTRPCCSRHLRLVETLTATHSVACLFHVSHACSHACCCRF